MSDSIPGMTSWSGCPLAKVMSRPDFGRTRPNLSVQARNRTMRGGNAELDPTTGVQFDLAVEWYFADYSILSVGLFTKNMDGFIQDDFESVPFPNIIDPITQQPLVLDHFTPLNTAGSSLVGLELSFQRTMADLLPAPFDGLGVITNYTLHQFRVGLRKPENECLVQHSGLVRQHGQLHGVLREGSMGWPRVLQTSATSSWTISVSLGNHTPLSSNRTARSMRPSSYAPSDKLKFAVEAINLTDEERLLLPPVGHPAPRTTSRARSTPGVGSS